MTFGGNKIVAVKYKRTLFDDSSNFQILFLKISAFSSWILQKLTKLIKSCIK